jgi:hypothetical protein
MGKGSQLYLVLQAQHKARYSKPSRKTETAKMEMQDDRAKVEDSGSRFVIFCF